MAITVQLLRPLLRDSRTVDVWVLPAAVDRVSHQDVRATLSADELERAARLRRDDVRDRLFARRYWLRLVLSGYVGA